MHSALLLATFALSILATPISQSWTSRMDIHEYRRANSRSEYSVETCSEDPKRVCKKSYPHDIDGEEYNVDTDAHHDAFGNRRSAQPEPILRAGSGRRQVDPDRRVIIKTPNLIKEETRSAGRKQSRFPEAEPHTRTKTSKRQPTSSTKSFSSNSQQSNSGRRGDYVRPAQKRTVEEESRANHVNEDKFDSEALTVGFDSEQETVNGRDDEGSAKSLPSDGITLATRGAGRTQARGAGSTQARNTDQEHRSVESQIYGQAFGNEDHNAEAEPVIRPIKTGGTPGSRGGKSSNKRAVKGPDGGSQCHPGTWSSRC